MARSFNGGGSSAAIWTLVVFLLVIGSVFTFSLLKPVSQQTIADQCIAKGEKLDATTGQCIGETEGVGSLTGQQSSIVIRTVDLSAAAPQSTNPNLNATLVLNPGIAGQSIDNNCNYVSTASGTKTCTGIAVNKPSQVIALDYNDGPGVNSNTTGSAYYGIYSVVNPDAAGISQGPPEKSAYSVDARVWRATTSYTLTFNNGSNNGKVTLGRDGEDDDVNGQSRLGVVAGQIGTLSDIKLEFNQTNAAWWLHAFGVDTISNSNITDVKIQNIRLSGDVKDINDFKTIKSLSTTNVVRSDVSRRSRSSVDYWYDFNPAPLLISGTTMTWDTAVTLAAGSLGNETLSIWGKDGGLFKSSITNEIKHGVQDDQESPKDIYMPDTVFNLEVYVK